MEFLWKIVTVSGDLYESVLEAEDAASAIDYLKDKYGRDNIQLMYVEAVPDDPRGFSVGIGL
jgi:hypothetical protein